MFHHLNIFEGIVPIDLGIDNAFNTKNTQSNHVPEILFITSYPPRECGIATYSEDLIKVLKSKYQNSFNIKICALETDSERFTYNSEVTCTLNTDYYDSFVDLTNTINSNNNLNLIVLQHEFGFFHKNQEALIQLIKAVNKPLAVVFHTVLPIADENQTRNMVQISEAADGIIVMTKTSANLLINHYGIGSEKIEVIPHGTHLVPHIEKAALKLKYHFEGRHILSTFGLLGSGKNIETSILALPKIVANHPDVLFLIIGKTHPSVINNEGETYRKKLETLVTDLKLEAHVLFINQFLPLPILLEYLQLTDVYLFTSNDPFQAVSGTFSYAVGCGCSVVSTPIPHAVELLSNNAGIIIPFESPNHLFLAVDRYLYEPEFRAQVSTNSLHRIAVTAWENSAVLHANLFVKLSNRTIFLNYAIPPINLDHFKKLTWGFGMVQFSKINHPDITSGFTLDDNARALIAICHHYDITGDEQDINYIKLYYNFIKHCLQPVGNFLNYVDDQGQFTEQNSSENLDDSNGRAIWALGVLISLVDKFPEDIKSNFNDLQPTMERALSIVEHNYSARAMAFTIKGLYYTHTAKNTVKGRIMVEELANRLVQMFRHESDKDWRWFESYLTYANSVLPEALLCAWMVTGKMIYRDVAKNAFDFLLSKTFSKNQIKVISNQGWMLRNQNFSPAVPGGEQPIDVAYTIMALRKFDAVFGGNSYLEKMNIAFTWFLGNNYLHQIIYNPCTGGCYDGLEINNVNLNQGAESTISYLMARLTIEQPLQSEIFIHSSLSTTFKYQNNAQPS